MWIRLSQSSRFTFGLEQSQNITLADGALNVPDDLSVLLADEFDFHLGTLSLGTGTSQNADDAGQRRWFSVHYV